MVHITALFVSLLVITNILSTTQPKYQEDKHQEDKQQDDKQQDDKQQDDKQQDKKQQDKKQQDKKQQDKKQQDKKQQIAPRPVKTAKISEHALPVRLSGVVQPFREVKLATQVAGKVRQKVKECQPGRFVRKGTTLLRIDTEDLVLEIKALKLEKAQRELELKQVSKQVATQQKAVDITEKQLKSLKKLEDAGKVSKAEVAQTERVLATERKSLELLQSTKLKVDVAQKLFDARLQRANLNLKQSEIVAPFDGIVTQVDFEKGDFVRRGQSLVVLEDVNGGAKVQCRITAKQLRELINTTKVKRGPDGVQAKLKVTVITDWKKQVIQWSGDFQIGTGIDPKTRTIPCVVTVSDVNGTPVKKGEDKPAKVAQPMKLIRGMYVAVTIPRTKPLLRIPAAAMRTDSTVWLLRKDTLVIKNAPVIGKFGNDFLIDGEATGIRSGEKVIVSPLADLINGLKVTPVDRK